MTATADDVAHDLDGRARAELARAGDPATGSTGGAPRFAPNDPSRKNLALVGVGAFTVVALVLGWRWSVASAAEPAPLVAVAATAPAAAELEVTVLEVRDAPRAAAPMPPPVIVYPPDVARPATATTPRAPVRLKRPPPARPASRPTSSDAAADRADPTAKPEPAARPALEANPYVYR